MDHKILVSITTTRNSDWRAKIEETKKLSIEEVALFPTCLDIETRKELYALLEETPVRKIPHVHIRNDMEAWELEFLMKKYQTEVFNFHPMVIRPFINDLSKFYDKIYIENVKKYLDEDDLKSFAGLCVDFSHWESFNLVKGDSYDAKKDSMYTLIEKYPIGCSHISAINVDNTVKPECHDGHRYSFHLMKNVTELDYMRKYLDFLPEIVSLELANSLAEQLKAKEYLEDLIRFRVNSSRLAAKNV